MQAKRQIPLQKAAVFLNEEPIPLQIGSVFWFSNDVEHMRSRMLLKQHIRAKKDFVVEWC